MLALVLVLQVPRMLNQVEAQLPEDFPQRVFQPIRRGLLAQAEKFIDALPD